MTATQIAEIAAMSEADVLAIAYTEAAGGDLHRALHAAAEDILTLEAKLEATSGPATFGYIRGAGSAEQG